MGSFVRKVKDYIRFLLLSKGNNWYCLCRETIDIVCVGKQLVAFVWLRG